MSNTGTGLRDNPAETTPDTIPAGCFWFLDPDGTLCLSPGCMARIQDPDAECLCDTLTTQHNRLKHRMRELKDRQKHADNWWRALEAAVAAHPDRHAILADTRRRAGR
ncbi:hypothetical protein K388_07245 [Streptomyces sp. KhCrAH-43]|uniref:hypothetical protein n=1 Tax=unclassified Streptomyces TaxID=2593676 RepID=UPI00036C4CD1|nr:MULTISPECIES: hypothetical protein [unclassified Streptomyces]MYS37597.1 hypothetical protein [Streptomyces sp. SID4920]MYX68450.1 hypothetical protein [Streptomyces sp. SID8373]RAJ46786.1 hypothetical protein K388_07245 [Streptomyces sp. KhCrAH-43]